MDEDEQPLEMPIIKLVKNLKFELGVKDSSTYVSTQFLLGLMSNPALVRNVTLVGHVHHGKTLFMDMLVEQTYHISTFDQNSEKHIRYTDTRIDEQERRISIKSVPMSLVLEDSNSKSYSVTLWMLLVTALRLADGAVLIVDAFEGVMVNTKRSIQHAIQEHIPIVLVINKLHGVAFDANKFASRLWGDFFFDPDTRSFKKKSPASGVEKSFVQFVLEPLYKIYSQVIGEHKKSVEATLAELGVTLSNAAYHLNVRPLLRLACSAVFGIATRFTDMLAHHIPSAKAFASRKVEHIYTGSKDSTIYKSNGIL
ncbi:hypothetical protein RND71_010861 [Anisodus tanguticus]|uniref:Tr-type G domain-containing protein n=1 Tax=Anisodus tanguticus TaxID=243964 RepID=A0AAE1SKM1_9SOLA|nr:hypothetical protein RND71_010861 [Anisodus tanguticus]